MASKATASEVVAFVGFCPITSTLLARWSDNLVAQYAPFFVSERIRAQLSPLHLIFTHSEFGTMRLSLDVIDSYQTYAVADEAEWVVLLSSADFDALPTATQRDLLYEQWQFGRGQLYPWEEVKHFFADSSPTLTIKKRQVETDKGIQLMLDRVIWEQFSHQRREQWLLHFVRQQQSNYSRIAFAELDAFQRQNPALSQLCNTFVVNSGANCFATTIAATTSSVASAHTTSKLWLHQAPFLRQLSALGYTESSRIHEDRYDTILIFWDEQNQAQHACYCLGDGIALNKNSQAWYHPRELVKVSDVIADWKDDQLVVKAYTR